MVTLFSAEFIHSNPNATRAGTDAQSEYYNYFLGKDRVEMGSGCEGFCMRYSIRVSLQAPTSMYTPQAPISNTTGSMKKGDRKAAPIEIKYEGADEVSLIKNNLIHQNLCRLSRRVRAIRLSGRFKW
jgi:hypothetical protein